MNAFSVQVTDMRGVISTIHETFGFIRSDQYGLVFFPGSAYLMKQNEPARLNAVFAYVVHVAM